MSVLSTIASKAVPFLGQIKMVAAGLAVALILFLWHSNHGLEQKIGAQKAQLDQAVSDNQSNVKTIGDLQDANKTFATNAEVDKGKIDVLSQQIDAQKRALQVTRTQLTDAQTRDRNAPNAKAFLDTDVSVVVPDLARRLRDEQSNLN